MGLNLDDMLVNFNRTKMLEDGEYHRAQFVNAADFYKKLTLRMDQLTKYIPQSGSTTTTHECLSLLKAHLMVPVKRFEEALSEITEQGKAARLKERRSMGKHWLHMAFKTSNTFYLTLQTPTSTPCMRISWRRTSTT